jgi:hypothetical protein
VATTTLTAKWRAIEEVEILEKYSENGIREKCSENEILEKFSENEILEKCSENEILENCGENKIGKKDKGDLLIYNQKEEKHQHVTNIFSLGSA